MASCLPLSASCSRFSLCGRSPARRGRRPALARSKTWEESKLYILEPFEKRGEMDQGILRFTWYSLVRVAKGYALALLIGTPLGFLLGMSKTLHARSSIPIIQILRPVSPLAWLPLGLVLFQKSEPAARSSPSRSARCGRPCSTPRLGVRAIPQDYSNVGRCCSSRASRRSSKILLPGDAALHVHRLPPEPRHRVARDRRAPRC